MNLVPMIGDIVISNVNTSRNAPNGIAIGIIHRLEDECVGACFDPLLPMHMTKNRNSASCSGGNFFSTDAYKLKHIGTKTEVFKDYCPNNPFNQKDRFSISVNVWEYSEKSNSPYSKSSVQELLEFLNNKEKFSGYHRPIFIGDDSKSVEEKLAAATATKTLLNLNKYPKEHVSGLYCTVSSSRLNLQLGFKSEAEFTQWLTEQEAVIFGDNRYMAQIAIKP